MKQGTQRSRDSGEHLTPADLKFVRALQSEDFRNRVKRRFAPHEWALVGVVMSVVAAEYPKREQSDPLAT